MTVQKKPKVCEIVMNLELCNSVGLLWAEFDYVY